MVEISEIENRKKGQKSLIGGPDPKIILEETHGVARNFARGALTTILCHFFEKPVLRQHFFGDARENMTTAHACGNTRAYIFSQINVNDRIYLQNKF